MSDQHQHHSGTGDNVGRDKIVHNHYPPPPEPPRQFPPLDACFLGRDEELTTLLEQLQPGKIAAVCGPGGMGKSALAAQAVHRLEEGRFPDGIVFHSFYGHPETELALQAICAAFEVEAKAGLAANSVRNTLADKKALLILDGAEEAEDLKAVLALRSTCGVLITTRKKADAQGFRLDLKPLEEQPAAAVFYEHSGAAANDASMQGICKILDGWPVGLRIAGRYLNSTGESAADYLGWLEQEPFKELGDGGHQEENAALLLRRSVAQVSDDGQLALGVAGTLAFAPIAREPVAAILEDDERRARKALGELVNYGLLETKEERWQISHALVHTYARTELPLNRESLQRLTGWYIGFCKAACAEHAKGYVRLDAERAHCLRLMESCLASKLWQELKALVEAIQVYLDRQGWWTEWQMAVDMSRTAAQQEDDPRAKALSLGVLGCTCGRRGELDKALLYHEQSLLIWRDLNDRQEESVALTNIAAIYDDQGYYGHALKYHQQSLMICREGRDRKGEGTALNSIAHVYMKLGEWKTALEYLKQSLTLREETGDKNGKGVTLANIGMIHRQQGTPEKALEKLEQALAIAEDLGDKAGEATRCWNLGLAYYDLGKLEEAAKYMSRTVKIEEDIGHPDLEKDREALTVVRAQIKAQ